MRGYHSELGQDAQACEAIVVNAKKLRLQHRSTPPSETMPDVVIYKPWEKKKLLLKQLLHAAQNNAAVSE